MNAHEIQLLEKKIQYIDALKYNIVLTVGIYAIEQLDSNVIEMQKVVNDICLAMDGVINTHGFLVEQEKKNITIDITVDFTVKDKSAFIQKVKSAISERYPEYVSDGLRRIFVGNR